MSMMETNMERSREASKGISRFRETSTKPLSMLYISKKNPSGMVSTAAQPFFSSSSSVSPSTVITWEKRSTWLIWLIRERDMTVWS